MSSAAATAPAKKSFWKSRRGQQITVIIAFTIIPVFLLMLFTYYPFAEMVKFSFYKMRYVGKRVFVGWDNYKEIFRRDDISFSASTTWSARSSRSSWLSISRQSFR